MLVSKVFQALPYLFSTLPNIPILNASPGPIDSMTAISRAFPGIKYIFN